MPQSIFAIDPGPKLSAYLIWNGSHILEKDILENYDLRCLLGTRNDSARLVIEWIESYGLAVGKEVFETCKWCGRFEEAYHGEVGYLTRKEIKIHHCHTSRANDSNVRTALIDRFGEPGTKKAPGLTYGLKKDLWSAFAIATCAWDRATEAKSA